MFGDYTEGPQGPQHVLHSIKNRFLKKPSNNDIELHSEFKSKPSTSKHPNQLAVYIRNAHKHYGTFKPLVVLDGLDMTVPKGSIYGLLGASGCGKTTLLSCIVGRKRFNSGQIWVLGGTPGKKNSGVPGPRIGYMPQETGLNGELSIRETFLYFGRVAEMSDDQIMKRCEFLVKLLMLPDMEQMVAHLSGGQQRRVSLGVAMVHEPELLILDEPTVGLDPLLRQIIWQHLMEITKLRNVTAIITTHYIEEARHAHCIGLMRGGYLLAEESPESLLIHHKTKTLEEVFLKLSISQNASQRRRQSSIARESNGFVNVTIGVNGDCSSSNIESEDNGKSKEYDQTHQPCAETNGVTNVSNGVNGDYNSCCIIPDKLHEHSEDCTHNPCTESINVVNVSNETSASNECDGNLQADSSSCKQNSIFSALGYLKVYSKHHMKALLWKNGIWMYRNKPTVLFVTFLPVIIVILFCTYIGRDPINLPVAVVNYETNNFADCNRTLSCSTPHLSCCYLGYLERRALILNYYDSEKDATQSVIKGDMFASIIVKRNYSDAMRLRLEYWQDTKPWDLAYSEIEVVRDPSNLHIANYLKVYLYETFQTFIRDYLEVCGINPKVFTIPIKFETPVYGRLYPNFTDFAIPGVLLSISFFVALSATAVAMLVERNEASLERTFVIGINEVELVTGIMICELGIMLVQSALALISAFVIFNMTIEGSILLVVIFIVLAGFCGICYGLCISCVCDRDSTTTFVAVGSLLPMLMMCGVIWPVEAMHPILKPFAHIFPLTNPTEALRSILQKNWGFSWQLVYTGFITVNVWTVIFLVVAIVCLKIKIK